MATKLQIWGAEISQDRAGEYVQQNCHVWCPKWILFKSPSVCWLKQGIPNLWMMKTQLIQQRVYNPEKNHQPTIIYQSTSSFMISYVEWLKRLKSLFSVNHNISHDLWFLGSVTVRSLICPDLLVKSREMPSFVLATRLNPLLLLSTSLGPRSLGKQRIWLMLWVKTLVP